MPRSSEDRGEFRGIYVALIDDPDFQRLSPEARLVFLVLKLKLRQYGIDVFYPESLPRLTGLPPKACEAALAELQADPRQSPGKPLRSPFDAPSMGQRGPYSKIGRAHV